MKLELTERQFIEIMDGMEFYQRFIIGQPDGNSILWDMLCEKGDVPYHEYDAWKHSTNRLFFPELSPGVKTSGTSISPTREARRHPTRDKSTLFTKKHTLGRYEGENLANFLK